MTTRSKDPPTLPGGISPTAVSVQDLPHAWRQRATDMARYGADGLSRALIAAADELEAALRVESGATVSLKEAAQESGYSADYLSRLVREGALTNMGSKRRPRIRRSDLPRRVRPVADCRPRVYDVEADARRLRSPTNGQRGDHGERGDDH